MIELRESGAALALTIVDHPTDADGAPLNGAAGDSAGAPPADRAERTLAAASGPLVAALRAACRMRTATLCAVLADLVRRGRVRRTPAGYVAAQPEPVDAPSSPS